MIKSSEYFYVKKSTIEICRSQVLKTKQTEITQTV